MRGQKGNGAAAGAEEGVRPAGLNREAAAAVKAGFGRYSLKEKFRNTPGHALTRPSVGAIGTVGPLAHIG